jgi:glycosyltransferase involved in cell wall biosynthesis
MHPLVHYITIGKDEGRIAGPTPDIISTAKQMIKEAGMIEPTILLEPGIGEPEFLPVNFGGEGWTRLPAWQKLFNSLDHAYDCLIFVPWLVRGGADLAAVNAVKASIENLGLDSVLLVVTDYDRKDAFNWLPPGTHVRVFSDFDSDMGSADRTLMTELLIRAVRPKSMLNVNSRACWDAMVQKGGALSKVCDLYAFLFCRDYTADGRPAGYADTHFRAALPFLRKVYFDNSGFMKELSRDFGIPEEFRSRLVTLHQPISADKPGSHKGGPVERNKVFWASRFSKQKNVELLIKIVEAAPDINFDIYGYGDLYYVNLLEAGAKRLPNLNLKGQFSSITDLPINNYNALLYTSLWDGLPLTLVDLAAMGVPIVASSVGGIPDFIDAETGWAIEAYEDPMHYVQALQHVLNNPDEAHLRSARMVERVITAHSWQPFKTTLSVRPSFAI